MVGQVFFGKSFKSRLESMNFFNTFRGRLLVILTLLLIVTLGVQFYLNYRKQKENNALIAQLQEHALVAGFALGVNSLTSEIPSARFRQKRRSDIFRRKDDRTASGTSLSSTKNGRFMTV